jgi:hypothetical protein
MKEAFFSPFSLSPARYLASPRTLEPSRVSCKPRSSSYFVQDRRSQCRGYDSDGQLLKWKRRPEPTPARHSASLPCVAMVADRPSLPAKDQKGVKAVHLGVEGSSSSPAHEQENLRGREGVGRLAECSTGPNATVDAHTPTVLFFSFSACRVSLLLPVWAARDDVHGGADGLVAPPTRRPGRTGARPLIPRPYWTGTPLSPSRARNENPHTHIPSSTKILPRPRPPIPPEITSKKKAVAWVAGRFLLM